VAVIGTIVNGLYSSNVEDSLAGSASPQLVEVAREGIGGAVLASRGMPAAPGASFVSAANRAFVDAITTGFRISATILVATLVAALTLLPSRMRRSQARLETEWFGSEAVEISEVARAREDVRLPDDAA
jgi:hypothetical protein